MAIYKKGDRFLVKISMNGRQILRRTYLGRPILDKKTAVKCQNDLFIQYSESCEDYKINDLLNLYEDYLFKKYKETTASKYLQEFNNHLLTFFKDRKVSEITRSYLVFINDSINNFKLDCRIEYIKLIKTFCIFLSNYGLKNYENIFYLFRKSRNLKIEYSYYTKEEFDSFLSVIEKNEDRLIFEILFYYGLRSGELRALTVKDFKSDRLSINKEITNKTRFGGQKVLDPKSKSSYRFYPYVKDIYDLFLKVKVEKDLHSKDFVFGKDPKVAIGESSIRRKILEYSNKANLNPIKLHEFRHSCATYLINKDIDIKDIANWLGHATINVTMQVYAHLLPLRKDNVKNVINTSIDVEKKL